MSGRTVFYSLTKNVEASIACLKLEILSEGQVSCLGHGIMSGLGDSGRSALTAGTGPHAPIPAICRIPAQRSKEGRSRCSPEKCYASRGI